ncbi:hypothetical protein L3V77_07845 [Vibrio sp. DW001]|uniref:hypothetical protein n=1 Tax=Vibrio sp. DW001 TaxID=2912315 RepID=UPI0023B088AB|nr:hypothetical protein [Vibrio sp. DW001]WED28128.1 hypothetical protein L3V77_07845 [Vibrio sp. DW001]
MANITIKVHSLEELESLYTLAADSISEIIHLPTEQERATLTMWKRIQAEAHSAINEVCNVNASPRLNAQ